MRVRVHLSFTNSNTTHLRVEDVSSFINVSNTDNTQSNNTLGFKGFQLSSDRTHVVSALDSSYRFFPSSGYPGIITQEISNADGTFTNPPVLNLKINGYSPRKLYVAFDRSLDEYATEIHLQGTTASLWSLNDEVFFTCDLDKYVVSHFDSHELQFDILKWSKPNASAKITYIATEYEDIFTGNTIIDIICSEHTMTSPVYIQPGIVEQYAEVNIYDRYNRIHEVLNDEALERADATLDILAVDDDNVETTVGSYTVASYDMQSTDKYVKITCDDPSSTFDSINVNNQPVVERLNVDGMLHVAFGYTKYPWMYIDSDTQKYCEDLYTPNAWGKATTLKRLLDKICTFGMLRIYWRHDIFVVMRCY